MANNRTQPQQQQTQQEQRQAQIQRRETRTKYRLLETEIDRNGDDLKQAGTRKLAEMIERVEKTFNEQCVEKTREQNLDVKVVAQLTQIGLDMSKNLAPTQSRFSLLNVQQGMNRMFFKGQRNDNTYAENDTQFVQRGQLDFVEFGKFAGKFFFDVDTMDFMNGVMDTEVKERKIAQKRQATKLGEVVRPDELEDTVVDFEKQTSENMKKMVKTLNKQPGCSATVVDLVFNERSFAQFVENTFTLSFLVRDGVVHIVREEGRPAIVKRVEKDMQETTEKSERAAHVLALDVQGWKALKVSRANKPGLLPHRKEADKEQLLGRTRRLSGVSPATSPRPKPPPPPPLPQKTNADDEDGDDYNVIEDSDEEAEAEEKQNKKKNDGVEQQRKGVKNKRLPKDITNSDTEQSQEYKAPAQKKQKQKK